MDRYVPIDWRFVLPVVLWFSRISGPTSLTACYNEENIGSTSSRGRSWGEGWKATRPATSPRQKPEPPLHYQALFLAPHSHPGITQQQQQYKNTPLLFCYASPIFHPKSRTGVLIITHPHRQMLPGLFHHPPPPHTHTHLAHVNSIQNSNNSINR